ARTPTGTPICERREIGTAGPTAITSAGRPSSSACRPARRSAARVEGARTVTVWPRSRSAPAIPATCSLTSCGCDHANGVTRQIRTRISLLPGVDERDDEGRRGDERRHERAVLRVRADPREGASLEVVDDARRAELGGIGRELVPDRVDVVDAARPRDGDRGRGDDRDPGNERRRERPGDEHRREPEREERQRRRQVPRPGGDTAVRVGEAALDEGEERRDRDGERGLGAVATAPEEDETDRGGDDESAIGEEHLPGAVCRGKANAVVERRSPGCPERGPVVAREQEEAW